MLRSKPKLNLETERLLIRPSSPEDEKNYVELFGDSTVMEKMFMGVALDEPTVKFMFSGNIHRWENNDPYSTYSIFSKENGSFMGMVLLNHEKELPCQIELVYALHHQFWNQGFGKEAVKATINQLIPYLLKDYKIVDGQKLKTITATARLDNPASLAILEKVGFIKGEVVDKFGALRCTYSLFAKTLRHDYQRLYSSNQDGKKPTSNPTDYLDIRPSTF